MNDFSQLSSMQWAILLISAFIQGVSKGGVPGFAVLAVPLVAMVVPGKASTGLVLPMLIIGDLFALGYWRRSVSVRDLMRALPWAIAGVVAGWMLLGRISDAHMRPIVGAVVLFILAIPLLRKLFNHGRVEGESKPRYFFSAFMGALGGVTTMLANAAGPVIGVYLLRLNLSKATFLGTSAWFFFIINWIKVPFMQQQGMITESSLRVNLMMVPALVCGVALGIFVAKRIDQKTFNMAVAALAALASLILLFS